MRFTLLTVALFLCASGADAKERRRERAKAPEQGSSTHVPEGIWTWTHRFESQPKAEPLAVEQPVQPIVKRVKSDPAELVFGNEKDPYLLKRVNKREFDIPIDINPRVVKWIKYYTGPGRKYYGRWLSRSTRYRPMMEKKLKAAGLPQDMIYLSMIESGFSPKAYSHAHAAGLWQFIPATGKAYDLRIDWWMDERRDPEKATDAALDYLTDLYKSMGDWHLAWAAYNTGPGRVKRAIKRAGKKDYWELVRQDLLHPDTKDYVPMILAAAIVGKHPERYGFKEIDYQDALEYDTQAVTGSVDLELLAKCARISMEDLQALNPSLRRWATPPEGVELRLPKGKTRQFVAALKKIPKDKRLTRTEHVVAAGETLSIMASNYGVKTSDLVLANHLDDANRIRVGTRLIVPLQGLPPSTSVASKAKSTNTAASATVSPNYTVKSGDTLSEIAARHHMSQDDLREWNSIQGDRIYVGQRLRVHKPTKERGATVTYTVRSGDSLSRIAQQYSVSVSDIQRWNRMASTLIRPGQKLKLVQ